MEKTRIRQHFENVMLNLRLMKQITVAMECLATVTASVVSERYERLSFQNARFLLFMSMDALNFHVQPSAPFNSIYLALIFGASSKWIRLLNDRMEKREKERKHSNIGYTRATHDMQFSAPNCWLTRTKMHCDVTHSQSVRVITLHRKQLTGFWPDDGAR